jgi:DNA-binding transcriptional MerR regulator
VNRKKAASPASPKVYRSIREVSAELEVKPHVLRYWETQFPTLRPKKNRAGNRIYRPEEVVLLTRIKELLYAHRFTIEGARRTLLEEKKPRASSKAAAAKAVASVPAAPATAPVMDRAERDRLAAELAEAHAERERLLTELEGLRAAQVDGESHLAAARAETIAARAETSDARSELQSSQAALDQVRADLATAVDREKTRAAAMAVLRQELLLLTRNLRAESESASAPEPRVSVRAAEENGAAQAQAVEQVGQGEQVEQEEPAFPVGAVPISVGA